MFVICIKIILGLCLKNSDNVCVLCVRGPGCRSKMPPAPFCLLPSKQADILVCSLWTEAGCGQPELVPTMPKCRPATHSHPLSPRSSISKTTQVGIVTYHIATQRWQGSATEAESLMLTLVWGQVWFQAVRCYLIFLQGSLSSVFYNSQLYMKNCTTKFP